MRFPLEARLKDGTPIQLQLAGEQDVQALEDLYRTIVKEGMSYPHTCVPDPEEFLDYWFRGKTTVVAYGRSGSGEGTAAMMGAFYLKPNWPGRARHVANAGFIVAPEWRNQGLGWFLGATMLQHARDLGYRSVIFNLVFSENRVARGLWNKLGFSELGKIPNAVQKDDGSFQDAIIMWKSLI
jgi:L-amino acid N-acyltransferase YncA